MGKRLYVGNLNYRTTEDELQQAFAAVGEVTSVTIIMDRETQRPKGFAFVEMADAAGAQAAIDQLNGTQLGGRTITVAEAHPREEGGRGPRGGQAGGSGFRSGREDADKRRAPGGVR